MIGLEIIELEVIRLEMIGLEVIGIEMIGLEVIGSRYLHYSKKSFVQAIIKNTLIKKEKW